VAKNVILAEPPHHLFGLVAGEAESPFIPVENAAFPVHKVHAIAHLVEQFLVKARINHGHSTLHASPRAQPN